MTRISSYRGDSLHAPENTREALLAAYTAGADVLEFDVQVTKDGQPVVISPTAIDEMSEAEGKVEELNLEELRKIDFGAKFKVAGSSSTPWKKNPPLARVESLGGMLDQLPEDATKVLQAHIADGGKAVDIAKKIISALNRRGLLPGAFLCSDNLEVLRAATEENADARLLLVCDPVMTAQELSGLNNERINGLILSLNQILDPSLKPTPLALKLDEYHQQGRFPLGAILRTQPSTRLTIELYEAVDKLAFVYALSVQSLHDDAVATRKLRKLGEASFSGEQEDSGRFHFGYAKPNRYAHVYQRDGVNIAIRPYQEPPPITAKLSGDEVQDRLNDLQEQAWSTARNWPFYSGGGFGTAFGIDGDFAAEVDFRLEVTSQATMCEMAAVNVDPAKHRPGWKQDDEGNLVKGIDGNPVPNVPDSFRDIDTFFDPHGAPPFVGVEHDEDDGYRINYNLGTQYENNQYGRPHGNGNTKQGRFRLERRGPYFAAYYKDEENSDWVSCGVCRNDSLNRQVFIRCAGKRWRQESDSGQPGEYFPIPHNHIIFRNFVVWTVLP